MGHAKGQVGRKAAETYDDFFVPALFGEWPSRVAEAARIAPGESVLDVACGTGILAREAARRAGSEGVVGLDCNEGMLAVARSRDGVIEWTPGRAERLPFDGALFDAVISQFGLMFFDDSEMALREMWRVLRPGGRLAVAVWGPLEATPGYASMVGLLERLFDASIADELRAPYSLGDSSRLRRLFATAGITGARIDTIVGRARFPSIAEWVHTEVRGWTLADRIDDAQLEVLTREAEVELKKHVDAHGGVAFAAPAHIVSARRSSSI